MSVMLLLIMVDLATVSLNLSALLILFGVRKPPFESSSTAQNLGVVRGKMLINSDWNLFIESENTQQQCVSLKNKRRQLQYVSVCTRVSYNKEKEAKREKNKQTIIK